MMQPNPVSAHFRDNRLPRFVTAHHITADYSKKHARMHHIHEAQLELLFIDQGEGDYVVDGRSYHVTEGDIVICNAGLIHGEKSSAWREMRTYCIAMTGVALQGLPDNHLTPSDVAPIVSCGMLTDSIREIVRLITLFSCDTKNLGEICTTLSISFLLMVLEIVQSYARRIPFPEDDVNVFASRIRQYIDQHYDEPLTLHTIGEALHANKYYISHVFKKQYGMPPMLYLYKRRIGEAQSLLIDTELSVAEIAERLCVDSCHFNSMFKKYVGMPLGKYRETFRAMNLMDTGIDEQTPMSTQYPTDHTHRNIQGNDL